MLPTHSVSSRAPRLLPVLLLATLLLAAGLPAAPTAAFAQAQAQPERGNVTGRITGAPEGATLAGTRVVLLQFRLTPEGQPEGNPIQTRETAADGSFAFSEVPIEERTVYQIGATVEGQVVGSEPFTFPAGQRDVQLNLQYPRVTGDNSGVRIMEGLIAVEPRRGGVWVTEVLHLVNGGQDTVEGVRRPLELNVPSGAEDLEVIREIQQQEGHERLGSTLLFYGNLEPGRTTVAFRYKLDVWLGKMGLEKRYPLPVGTLSVLSPEGTLRLHGERFAPQEQQQIDGTPFDAWAATGLNPGEPVTLRFSGVPVRQEVYLVPLAGFFLVMGAVVIWFLRRRLPADGEAEESA